MGHPLFGPEVRLMLEENNVAGMKAFCESLHPTTAAETLAEDAFSPEEVWRVLSQTDIRNQAAIFEYFPSSWQVKMVGGTGREKIARLIEQMSHDDRVDLLRRLSPVAAENLLRLVDEADRRDIADLFRYKEGTVGAIMTTDYAWLPDRLTAGQAIDRLRQQAPDRETIYYVYILDEPTRRLIGTVSLRDLILADRAAPVRDIMETDLVILNVDDDREKAASVVARYDFIALPVVDHEGHLVGIITHDDVMDVMEQEATEDLQKQAGVGPIFGNYLRAPFFEVLRKRAFWLACLFGAELLTFTALAAYQDALSAVLVLGLFIPLCISTGGNSGSQAATLITRSLALGHVRAGDWLRVLRHEFVMGAALGLVLGVIAVLRCAATPEEVRSEIKTVPGAFEAYLPADAELRTDPNGRFVLPAGAVLSSRSALKRETRVTVPPSGQVRKEAEPGDDATVVYHFPPGCVTRAPSVDRWELAFVVAQAVAAICLWGTLIGAMLPLLFRRLGVDPALASSPFVATFVDVTGIVIYFNIAKLYLL